MTHRPEAVPYLIRVLLLLLPGRFRQAFAADMEAAFLDGIAERGTAGARVAFTLRTALDLIRTAFRERRSPTVHGPGRDPAFRVPVADRLWSDLRLAARSLGKRPGFTVVAAATLSLGIGANSAVFSIVDSVLLKPLPYVDPDGLVMVYAHDRESPDGRGVMSLPDTEDAAALPGFETLVGYREAELTLTSDGEPEVLPQGRVTDGILATFGLRPVLGRDIDRADNEQNAPRVVVIGYRFWQDRLGGSADVIGSTLELSGAKHEIIGVAPAGFGFPGNVQLWTPRRLNTQDCGRGCHTLLAIGRLARGSTVESAQTQLTGLASRLSDAYPESNFDKRFRAVRLADDRVADVRSGLWFVFGAVALVLLIACANVANLLIVRGESRRGELAVRSALGASRRRLAAQVLMESLLLALVGVAGGLVVARLTIALVRLVPAGTLPGVESVSLDGRVVLFTLTVGLMVAVIFGVSPALRDPGDTRIRDLVSGRRTHGTRSLRRARSVLLAGEVALSVLLLAGAGLLLKSFDRLYRTELGFEPDNLTRFRLVLPSARYDTLPAIAAFYSTLEERLAAIPGVESVGSAYGPPLGFGHITGDVEVEGRVKPAPGDEIYASMHSVTPGHLDVHRLPLIEGRWIEPSDALGTTPVAVVSETFVAQVFPSEDPIGKRFRVTANFGFTAPVWTVVGVTGDVASRLRSRPEGDVYVPLSQFGPGSMTITLRSRSGVVPVQALTEVVHALDPALPLRSVSTVRDAVNEEVAPTRFYLVAVGSFAALAVLLACVGLYGVVAYLVARRTSEIGIRMALGARRGQVTGLVLSQGLRPALLGAAVGLGIAIAASRVAEAVVYQVSPRDPVVLGGATALILAVAVLAAVLPARRASRIDPVTALRTE